MIAARLQGLAALVLAGLLLALSPSFAIAQNPDPAATTAVFTNVGPKIQVNSATTGGARDKANYGGAMYCAEVGHTSETAGARIYVVLQDSNVTLPAQGWTTVDSLLADSIENNVVCHSYTSNHRFLRTIARATSASTDTSFLSVPIVLVGARFH